MLTESECVNTREYKEIHHYLLHALRRLPGYIKQICFGEATLIYV